MRTCMPKVLPGSLLNCAYFQPQFNGQPQKFSKDLSNAQETQSMTLSEKEYSVPQRSQPTTPTRSRTVSRASSFADETQSQGQPSHSGKSSASPGTPRRSKSPARLIKTYSSSSVNSGRIDRDMESLLPPVVSTEEEDYNDIRSPPRVG